MDAIGVYSLVSAVAFVLIATAFVHQKFKMDELKRDLRTMQLDKEERVWIVEANQRITAQNERLREENGWIHEERKRNEKQGETIAQLDNELERVKNESSRTRQDYDNILREYQALDKSCRNRDGEIARLKNLFRDKVRVVNELSRISLESSRKTRDISDGKTSEPRAWETLRPTSLNKKGPS